MSLWMSWTLDDAGSASRSVDDIAAAVSTLDGSVERARRAFGSDEPAWEQLRDTARLMRSRLLDDGREAVERGQTWSLSLGGLHVQVTPEGHVNSVCRLADLQ